MLSLTLFFLCLVSSALSRVVRYNWSIDWVTASPDGFSRPVVGINGQWPCPQIDINKGDRLIVQVHNNLGNESTSLHWHGISQYGSANMDGTAGVTQCPIPPGSSFTYDFEVFISTDYTIASYIDSSRSINRDPSGTIRIPKGNIQMACEGRSLSMIPTQDTTSTRKSP